MNDRERMWSCLCFFTNIVVILFLVKMDEQGRFFLPRSGLICPTPCYIQLEQRALVRDLLISSTPCLKALSIQPSLL